MPEVLKINNFITIKRAELEIKSINIIIGPQANGKSLIAKLDYYFKNLSKEFFESIRLFSTKRELDAKFLEKFESYFPRYTWDGTDFEIEYEMDGLAFLVTGKSNAKKKTKLSISYSRELYNIFNNKRKLYKNKLEARDDVDEKKFEMELDERVIFAETVQFPLLEGSKSDFFNDSVFIPASRSFFANLQKNIFTFLASNLDIDPFIKEFGSVYETSKRVYNSGFFRRNKARKEIYEQVKKAIQSVVGGAYEYSEEQDWIISKNRRVNLANASSGQQEALPMLLTLCVWPFRGLSKKGTLFIEEPEAHLFPTSQSYIVSVLSVLRGVPGSKFFITTHSPYILSALNNLVLAYDVIESGKMSKEKFSKINGLGEPIRYEDVSAYTIINGEVKSIKDDELRMVGGDMLDEVSESFEYVANELLSAEGSE